MDPEICCYAEEVGKAGIQVALTKPELKIMGLMWLNNYSKAPFLSPKRNTEMLVPDRKKKMLQQFMEPKQLGTVNFNQSPVKMFQVIGSRFRLFIFIFSPSTPSILLYLLGPRHKNKLFPSFPWTVVGTAMLYWWFSDTLKSLRSWIHVELRRCVGGVNVSSLWLLEQSTAHITHFFPCGSGKSKWSCAG